MKTPSTPGYATSFAALICKLVLPITVSCLIWGVILYGVVAAFSVLTQTL